MAWTSPMTFAAGQVLTAAQMNTHCRDNLMETMAGKATASGGYFVSTGYNRIAERRIASQLIVTSGSTSSNEYTDLGNVGPAVTVTHGTRCLVFASCDMQNSGGANSQVLVSWEMTGDNQREAQDVTALIMDGVPVSQTAQFANADLLTGLTPGTTTFTMKYRVTSGTGTFGDRSLIVMPF